MNDYKKDIERVEYATSLIRELEKNLINLSNVFDEIKVVKKIMSLIDDFKGKMDFLLLDMKKFEQEYTRVSSEIKMEIEKYRNELLQELRANYALEYSANYEIFKKYKSIIDKTSNVFAIYSAYTSARRELENGKKVIKLSPTYIGDKIEYLRRRYIGDFLQKDPNANSNKFLVEINNLINSLIKSYDEKDVLIFEADVKVVTKNIEDIIRKYQVHLFKTLEDDRLFHKFPGAKRAYRDQLVNNYGATSMSDVYDAYLSTKSLIETVVKRRITKTLKEVLQEYESRDDYVLIEKKVDKIIASIVDNYKVIVENYTKSTYSDYFRRKIEGAFLEYYILAATRTELIVKLEKFSANPTVWSLLGKLNDVVDYDEMSELIKQGKETFEKLEDNLRIRRTEEIKNFIYNKFMYLELKTQYQFIDIISEAIKILMSFQKKEDVDIEILKELSFTDIESDRKIIRKAKKMPDVEEDKFKKLLHILSDKSGSDDTSSNDITKGFNSFLNISDESDVKSGSGPKK